MVLGKAFGARPRGAVPNVTTFTELFAVAESSPESGFAILADPGPIIVEDLNILLHSPHQIQYQRYC